MRKTFIGLLAASAIFMSAPAQSHTFDGGYAYIFQGAAPCAVACSYWVDNGYTPCENPFPPGTYLDKPTVPTPLSPKLGGITILEATLDATVDWDSFLCASTNGVELAQGANILGDECDNILGPNNVAPVGCHEDMSTIRKAGLTTVFRAYNWSDVGPAPAAWHFLFP